MSFKKVFWLGVGYVAGNVVSSLYNDKKGKNLRKKISKKEGEGKEVCKEKCNALVDNFVSTHKNLAKDLGDIVMSDKNKGILKTKKKELEKIFEDYKIDGERLLASVKEGGEAKATEVKEKLVELYENREEIISKVKDASPKTVEEFKQKLSEFYETSKKKIDEKVKEMKKK